jgi:transposase
MRGADEPQTTLFSYLSVEDRIPADHPLRTILVLVNPILTALSQRFETFYARMGRPSIPPERLLRALLLQVLFTIRSERQLMEQLNYNLLFRWFVGLNPDDAVWVPTVFSKNRDRLIEGEIADAFLQEVLQAADQRGLLSHEHFTVDGTLLEAWASHKSFRPQADPSPPTASGGTKNPAVDFRGEKRSNATHQSVTDPDARLTRKSSGTASILGHLGSVVMDNRHGLIGATDVRAPGYDAEGAAAVAMLETLPQRQRRRTVGADRGYDRAAFVEGARAAGVTPHVAQNIHARKSTSAIDGRTTRHAGYAISQVKRKLVEEVFGWGKTIGGLCKMHQRGHAKVGWLFRFTTAAYNLVRMRMLMRVGVAT